MVSSTDKKKFLHWFLNNYQLKKRESAWILNYLVGHQEMLENVTFIDDGANYCDRAIVITAQCSNATPFRFYKGYRVLTGVEEAFHDIRLNKHEQMYIQLNFKDSYKQEKWLEVVEDNTNIPDDIISEKYGASSEEFLDQCLKQGKLDLIKKQIDAALDNRDEQKFNELYTQLILVNK